MILTPVEINLPEEKIVTRFLCGFMPTRINFQNVCIPDKEN